MASAEDLRRLALALPEVTDDGEAYAVRGKGFAWPALDREAPRKPRVRIPGVWAIRTDGLEEKQSLMDARPDAYFSSPHYNGYPAVLVRIAEVPVDELAELVTDGWRVQAPRKLVKDFDAGHPAG